MFRFERYKQIIRIHLYCKRVPIINRKVVSGLACIVFIDSREKNVLYMSSVLLYYTNANWQHKIYVLQRCT